MEENNTIIESKISYIAIYLRISKEDPELEEENRKENKKEIKKKREESNSIQNQRELLLQFIQSQKEFTTCRVLEFSDDGYSGTNWDRPAVKQLLEQVKQRKIACILVKDFSRFSRDYIELGTYLEQIFPFFGVRFLSLNDAYDSAKEQGTKINLESAFQNLFYDWYSKELSIKVKTSLKIKKEKGQYISPHPPNGYQKDRTNPYSPYHVVVNKKEAEVVQTIFSLALEGKTLCEIARFLNQKEIPTQTNTALWRAGTIHQILNNPFYTGDMLYEKYKKKKVGGKSELKAREEWKCISNHHTAIIEREQFEKVQNIRKKKKRKKEKISSKQIQKKDSISCLFVGKLFCKTCQKALQIKNTKDSYFTCTTRYIAEKGSCVERLEGKEIGQIVEQIIEQRIVFDQIKENMFFIKNQSIQQKKEELQKRIQQIQTEQERIRIKNTIEYKKYALGDMEKETYWKWKNQIQKKEEELIKLQEKYYTKLILLKKIEQEENIVTLCRECVDVFIKKIFVLDKQKVIIYWNFRLF